MAPSQHHVSSEMLPGVLTVIVALAAAAESAGLQSSAFVCPKLNATHACTCEARTVICDGLGISDISFIAASASSIEILFAAHNELRDLPADFLHGAANLTNLTLSHNKIASIDPHFFESLPSVIFLDLSYNELKEFYLPGSGLPRLQKLDLTNNVLIHLKFDGDRQNKDFSILRVSRNNLSDLRETFPYNELKQLFLSQNKIQNNLGFLHNMTKLKLLTLDSNNISEIPYSVFPCNRHLKYLYLNKNRLSDLRFLNCTEFLYKLNISSNVISTIPESIFENMTLLDTLLIADNNITDSSFLNHVTDHIKTLDLSRNKLRNVRTDHMKRKVKLHFVDLSHNMLTDINFAGHLKKLETLLASNNKISQIDGAVFLTRSGNIISNLSLSNNFVSNVNFLTQLRSLINLNLSKNRIYHIEEDTMAQMRNLTTLDLSNNRINNVDFVLRVPRLVSLDLSNNDIGDFPCNSFMQRAYLDGNHITSLRLNCAPYLRYLFMYGGVFRDRKEQDLLISKEVLLYINNKTITFPCIQSMNVVLKCKEMCSSEDVNNVECEPQRTIFTSPIAIVIYCISVPLGLLGILLIFSKCFRIPRRSVDVNRQCLCGRNDHVHRSLTRNELHV